MSAPPPAPSRPDDTSLESWERALLDRQLAELSRLADMGMAMAAAIERRVTAEDANPPSNADLHRAAMDFARVSRAVRMTFALQSRLVAEFKGAGARPARAEPAGPGPLDVVWSDDVEIDHAVQKRQVRGIVQRLAEAASLDREGVERLVAEAGERLEDELVYRDLTTRPVGEIVALICKDLGLEPDWDRIAGEYWAEAEIARPPPGSPYAGWKARHAPAAPPPLVPSG